MLALSVAQRRDTHAWNDHPEATQISLGCRDRVLPSPPSNSSVFGPHFPETIVVQSDYTAEADGIASKSSAAHDFGAAADRVAARAVWVSVGPAAHGARFTFEPFTWVYRKTGSWVSEPNIEYADVADIFRHLSTLAKGSIEYQRQRDRVVERCLPVAEHIARRFSNRGEPLEDLVQVARVGLINAVNRFDANKGAEFMAFAVPTIMGEVRRHFRDHGWSVQVPRRLKELGSQLRTAREELSHELGRAPTATEIAGHLGIDREDVVQAQVAASAYSTWSTDAPLTHDGSDRATVSDGVGCIDANLEKVLDVLSVRPLVEALPEREQTVLLLRFFENRTQTQIAERLGISQMHVSRLLARSLRHLQEAALAVQRV